VPPEVRQFLRLPGLGPKTAARIWRELDVTTLDGLREAAEQQRLRTLQGLGAKSEEKILEALAKGFGPEPERRGLLGVGLPVVQEVVEALRAHPAAVEVSGAGSVRRGRETFRDLDVIATATEPAALIEHFVTQPWVLEVAARGDTKATVVTKQGFRLDLRVVPPDDYGSLLQHFTGSKDHNVALREEAQRRGLSISEYGVTVVETGEVHRFRDEDELYRFLGYAPIPPELRENAGELAAARNRALPALVEVSDLSGELHCHSTWSSDGKGSIEEMARTAKEHGYSFLALTDHSHYLRDGRMEAQWREIDEVNERLKPFRVLKGVEANIRSDGSVDVADEVLAELDWVVASLHQGFDRSPTERVLAALDHPHVDCIGHLTGRKLNKRAGADIDVEKVVARAVETGTALEINSQPDRLDLRDAHARLAAEAGVLVPVNTDAHSTKALGYRNLGIAQARRGWLTKENVLNTRPWREIAKLRK
jgi:DNA polymerase (family 10)